MDQDTPAIQIRDKDLAANCSALRQCLAGLPRSVRIRTVLDIRYGRGGWAQEVLYRFPQADYQGFEQHAPTAQIAWKNEQVSLHVSRFPEMGSGTQHPDLLLADFNTLTQLKRELLDQALSWAPARYLIFTDVSCSKLHLNYRSYGLEEPSLEEYWKRFPVPGYVLVTWAKEHHAASSALYQRKRPAG